MKKALIILMVFIVCNVVLAQDSLKVKLLYHWDDSSVLMYNEVWGLVQNNREYAVIGALEGTYFFDITNPDSVAELGFVPGKEGGCIHRDYHDYNGYLYMVADEGASSLQIIDLSYLPDSLALVYDSDALFTKSHNIFIDSTTARLYTCGGDQNNGLRVFSLADPLNPIELVNFSAAAGYVHDVYVRDDTAYVHGGGAGFYIYDLTDIINPQLVGSLTSYPTKGYNHSGWLSQDEMIYCFADETTNTDIKVCDVSDFGNITVLDTVNSGGDINAIPHNLIIKNGYLYASYYQDGLWIYDISDPANTSVVGYYDTHPAIATSYGAWGVYPLLPSGVVLVSDMANGLFVLDVTDAICNNPVSNFSFTTSNLTADFIDASTFKGNPAYSWDYGDGSSISTLQNPSHTYTLAGTYNVCLTIVDSCGSNLICQSVTVLDSMGCPPPSSYFGYSANGLSIMFADSSIVSGNATYSWDFGDGSGSATQQNPSYTYAASGTYNVCLTVTDSCGIATMCNAVTITLGTGKRSTFIEIDWWVGPNPFYQDFSVFLPIRDDGLIEYSIYDFSGKRVSFGVGLIQNGKMEISDVGELLAGIYLLELKTNNLYLHEKIVKFLPLR